MLKKLVLAMVATSVFGIANANNCPPTPFNFWVDVSGSMMQPQSQSSDASADKVKKVTQAKEVMKLALISNNGDASIGLYTVGPFTVQQEPQNLSAEDYVKLLEEKIPENLESVGRMTWLGKRAQTQLNQEKNVFLITDGAFSKWKEKLPVKEVFDTYKANGGKLTILSLASTEEEKNHIETIFGNSTVIDLAKALKTEESKQALVEKILNRRCMMELRGINFEFDKYTLTAESRQILDIALEVIRQQYAGKSFEVVGWTDYIGTDAYNKTLSEARAKAVKDYFIAHGIDAKLIADRGEGKSFKYDNKTRDGRWMNRRTDIVFE